MPSTSPAPAPTPPRAGAFPASVPMLSAVHGAAVAAIGAIAPLADGRTPNWAVLAATFLVVFAFTFLASAYHLNLPSQIQALSIDYLGTLFTALLSAHQAAARVSPADPAGAPPPASAARPSVPPSPAGPLAGL